MKSQCKIQKHNVSDETRALCKRLGCSVLLYQAMEFWMRESIRWCEAGLCGNY